MTCGSLDTLVGSDNLQFAGSDSPSCSEGRSVGRSESRYCDGQGHQPGHHPQDAVAESLRTEMGYTVRLFSYTPTTARRLLARGSV